jgi:hypothetical protein
LDDYPDGHGVLAQSLSNLGLLLLAQGKLTEAESLCRDTLVPSPSSSRRPVWRKRLCQLCWSTAAGRAHARGCWRLTCSEER